ncbi:MAG: DNA-methyltransferase [Chloroflexota bacterium]
MQPYYEDARAGITIYHGRCEEGLTVLGDGSVDLILTDPPYNVSSRGGRTKAPIGRVRVNDRGRRKRSNAVPSAATGRTGGEEDYRELRRDFGAWDHEWRPGPFLAEVGRLLRNGGSLVAFTSEFLLADYLASGLSHRSLIYWWKTNPTPSLRKTYLRGMEIGVWQTKGPKWTFNAGGYQSPVYAAPTVSKQWRVHPTQKPEEIAREILAVHSKVGDLVVDPYMGSGTFVRAAKDLHRRCAAFEIDERSCEQAAIRMGQGVLPFADDDVA